MAKPRNRTRSHTPETPIPREQYDDKGAAIVAVVVTAIAFLAYVRTLSSGMQMGDGTELATCAHVLGVPHPTGYPMYMLLLKLWLIITVSGEVIVRTTLLNALFMAAAAGVVTLIAHASFSRLAPGWSAKTHMLGAAAAGLTTAFLRFHWDNAVVTEVYALQFLLMVLFVWIIQKSENALRTAHLVLAGVIVGLGLAHHRMSVFLVLPMVYVLWHAWRTLPRRTSTRALSLSMFALLAPLLLYAYLPMRANSALSWGDTGTVRGFIEHVRGTEYLTRSFLRPAQGRSFTPETYVAFAAREAAQIAGDFAGQFAPIAERYYYDRFVERRFLHLAPQAILLLVVTAPFAWYGGMQWKRSSRATFFVSLAIAAQNLFILFVYNILDIRDYYLFPMWFGWMCIWFGILGAVSYIATRRNLALPAIGYACLIPPAVIAAGNFSRCDQSQNNAAELLSASVLPNLPVDRTPADADLLPNSILLTGGDYDSFTSWYRQLVRRERADVLIFASNFIWKSWYPNYFSTEQKQRYQLKFAPTVAHGPDGFARQLREGVIDANITSTPIYTCLQDPAVLYELNKTYQVRPVAGSFIQDPRAAIEGSTITLYRIEPRASLP